MTYEDWSKRQGNDLLSKNELAARAFYAGAASRDAEVAELKRVMKFQAIGNYDYQEELKQERDQLREQVTLLRMKLAKAVNFIQPYNIAADLLDELDEALAATEPKGDKNVL